MAFRIDHWEWHEACKMPIETSQHGFFFAVHEYMFVTSFLSLLFFFGTAAASVQSCRRTSDFSLSSRRCWLWIIDIWMKLTRIEIINVGEKRERTNRLDFLLQHFLQTRLSCRRNTTHSRSHLMDLFITFQSELISVYSSLDTSICVDYKFRANRMNFLSRLSKISFILDCVLQFPSHSYVQRFCVSCIWVSFLAFSYEIIFYHIYSSLLLVLHSQLCCFFSYIRFHSIHRRQNRCWMSGAFTWLTERYLSGELEEYYIFFLLDRKLKFLWERVTILIFSDDDYLLLEISEKMQSSASTGNEQRRFFGLDQQLLRLLRCVIISRVHSVPQLTPCEHTLKFGTRQHFPSFRLSALNLNATKINSRSRRPGVCWVHFRYKFRC